MTKFTNVSPVGRVSLYTVMDELARFSDGHLGARVGNARLRAVLQEAMSEHTYRAGTQISTLQGAVATQPRPAVPAMRNVA